MESKKECPARIKWFHNEDWLALLVAIALIANVLLGWRPPFPKLGWKNVGDLGSVFSKANLLSMVSVSCAFIGFAAVALRASLGRTILQFVRGAVVIFSLSWLAQVMAANAGVKAVGLEYVLFSLGLGLLWSHTLPTPQWLVNAARTEFFIKTGIVILGAGMLFGDLVKAGVPGMIQALLVIPVVWYATFWLAKRLRVDEEFGVMLSTAVSICGVSAAIAACGAIQGDKKKLSYVTSIVLLCAVPMMVLMPWCVKWLGLSEAVGGAWLGGTLDTSGSVVAATEMVGEVATKTGTVVKLSQNVLIGVAAFVISVWWTIRDRRASRLRTPVGSAASVDFGVIWERFPKFVLGFIAASLVFSFVLTPEQVEATKDTLKNLREVWFAAAFVSIGLETRLGEIATLGGGRPAFAFLGGQAINILWTLVLAKMLFGS